jgi:hypothetical protein
MIRFIEKNVLILLQWVGLFFAVLLFIVVIGLGYYSFEKINTTFVNNIKAPVIEFSSYQNSSSTDVVNLETDIKIKDRENIVEKSDFDNRFNKIIAKISSTLKRLPDDVIDKDDLTSKVEVLVKIKSNPYPQELQLAYASSLEELTQQMVNINDHVNVDEFIKWHDQEFAFQVNSQTQQNALKMSAIKDSRINGFVALGLASVCLVIFMMFVMMFVLLKIEKNTK